MRNATRRSWVVLLALGCTPPLVGVGDGGSDGGSDAGTPDAGEPIEDACADVPDAWRIDRNPIPPASCDDRNGGCDPRATCDASSGEHPLHVR